VKAVVFAGAGGNEVVSLAERPDPAPVGHDVLVAARFAGINHADLAQRQGFYPPPPGSPSDVPGLEVSGVVQTVGEQVNDWRPGDRVFGIVGGGGLADRVIAHERHLAAVPAGLGEQAAAAVPEAYITAHDALFTRGGLKPGEVLLVNGANGAVGTAGVQLALAAGARAVASVRSAEAGRGLADDGAIVVTPQTAAARLAALGGADVVLELVGAPNLELDLGVAAVKARIVIVGHPAGADGRISLRHLMTKRLSLHGTVLRARPLEEKAAAVQAFRSSVVPLLAAAAVAPRIDRVFGAAEVTAAFDYLGKPGKSGKVLLDFG
jgi:NADPH2:quinone reductase